MGKITQIVQDKSEVCVSGSWFISGGSDLGCVTHTKRLSTDGANAADIVRTVLQI